MFIFTRQKAHIAAKQKCFSKTSSRRAMLNVKIAAEFDGEAIVSNSRGDIDAALFCHDGIRSVPMKS